MLTCAKLQAGAEGDSRGFGFPTISEPLNEDPEAADIIEAAAAGKVQAMVRFAGNPALYCCDYDSRTALHLAASEGHLDIVKCALCLCVTSILEGGCMLELRDCCRF